MGRKLKRFAAVVVAAAVLVALAPWSGKVHAVPSFARKYRTSCMTCHVAPPKLNAVGRAFRHNGYKFEDDEALRKEEPVEMGDEAYKDLWPKAVWPSDIPGTAPIGFRFLPDITIDPTGTAGESVNLNFPHEVEIFIAASLGDKMSTFAEIEIEGDEVEAAYWLQFEDLFGVENALNLKLGNVGGTDFGFMGYSDMLRLTKTHQLYVDWSVPYPDSAVAFDTDVSGVAKNTYRIMGDDAGIELNGFGSRWRYVVGMVEGDGGVTGEDLYYQIAFKIGGLGFDGSGGDGDLLTRSEPWRDDSVTLSVFGYNGKALVNADGAAANDREDTFTRIGLGAEWRLKDLSLGGGFITGNNDNPYGTFDTGSVTSQATFIQAQYVFYPWLIGTLRWEDVDFDVPPTAAAAGVVGDQTQIIASVSASVAANARIILEGKFDQNDSDNDRIYIRIDYAF